MDLGLADKVACVAAASAGLGFAVARRLAAEGARVALCSRDESRVQDAAARIARETGAQTTAVACDLASPDGPARFVEEARGALGPVELLVCNAGGPAAGTFDELDDAAWERAFQLTLMSAVRLIRAALPDMRDRRFGRILAITSISAREPVDGLLLSNAFRAAVTGLVKTLSREVGCEGVTVNAIMPGYTATERLQELARGIAAREHIEPTQVYERWAQQTAVGRIATVEEFAATAAFLLSDKASSVTGAAVPVDGGWLRSIV